MQKFFRRNKERILLKDPTDDDVNHGVTSKLTEMVGTDNCVFMATPHLVYSRLFVAALEAVPHKREQYPIFLVVAVEESADVTSLIEQRAGKRNWCGGLLQI
jgi:hypothetical protein